MATVRFRSRAELAEDSRSRILCFAKMADLLDNKFI